MDQSSKKKTEEITVQGEAKDFIKEDIVGASLWRGGAFKKAGYITGASWIGRGAASSAKGTIVLGKTTSAAVKRIWNADKKIEPLETTSNDEVERFRVAQEKYGYTDASLDLIEERSRSRALIYVGIMFLATLWSLWMVANASGDNWISSYVLPWFIQVLFFGPTFRMCFWSWQMRTRRLGSVREFVRSPSEWIPPVAFGAKAMIALAGAVSAYFLLPDVALAQQAVSNPVPGVDTTDISAGLARIFDPIPATDLFTRMIGTVFGGIGPIPEIPGEPAIWAIPIGNAFLVFNLVLMGTGGLMLGWHTISGMVATAHEGQVLGQRWHQIWAPVRVSIGISLLAPISNGFSIIQIFVLHVTMMGTAMANMVWDQYITTFDDASYLSGVDVRDMSDSNSAALFALSRDDDARGMIMNMFESNVCLQGLRIAAEQTAFSANIRTTGQGGVPDFSSLSPAQINDIFGDGWVTKSVFSVSGMRMDGLEDNGDALSLQEIALGSVFPQVMVKSRGALESVAISEWSTVLDANPGAAPVVTWNYGDICGRTTVNLAEMGTVAAFLDDNRDTPISFNAGAAVMFNTADTIGRRVASEVMAPLSNTARAFAQAAVEEYPSAAARDAARAALYQNDGQFAQEIAGAYASLVDILEDERATLHTRLHDLGQTAETDNMVQMARELGWAGSGSFFIAITKLVENHLEVGMLDASIQAPDYTSMTLVDSVVGGLHAETKEKIANLEAEANEFRSVALINTFASSDMRATANEFNDSIEETDLWNKIQGALNQATKDMLYPVLDAIFKIDPNHALMHMVNLGHFILGIAMTAFAIVVAMIAVKVAAFLVGGTISATPVVGWIFGGLAEKAQAAANAVADVVATIFTYIGWLLLAVAVIHAYVLPSLPYIYVTMFVILHAVLVFEAIIAAPIFAFLHVRLDGSELVDNPQRAGYMILFNLFLRPTLMVFGLIGSMALFGAGIFLINESFAPMAEVLLPDDRGFALVGVVSMILIALFLHYQIALRSFALITQIPDRVTRWFGAQAEGLNEEGDTTAVVGVLNRQAEDRIKSTGGAMSMMGKRGKSLDDPSGETGGGSGSAGGAGSSGPGRSGRNSSPTNNT